MFWEEIKILVIVEDDDLLGRKLGEVLVFEIGKDEEWVVKIKVVIGFCGWVVLY